MKKKLLFKYLDKQCSTTEIEQIEQWLSLDSENKKQLFELEKIWSLKNELYYSRKERIDTAYLKFKKNINKEKYKKNRFSSFLKYASILLIISLLSINIYFQIGKTPYLNNTIDVPPGQRVSLTLSDGTKVWINGDSHFTYPAFFKAKKRNVTLTGEAFFEVKKDNKKPFIVSLKNLDIKVLGTSFNVNSYPSKKTTITLAKGNIKVSTKDNKKQLLMNPNEQVSYTQETGLILNKQIEAQKVCSWINGEINYNDTPLSIIAKGLEDYYKIKITIPDKKLASKHFTCRFRSGISLHQALKLLKETRELNYRLEDNHLIFYNP